MSMILYLRQASISDVKALRALVESPPAAHKPAKKSGLLARLFTPSEPIQSAPTERGDQVQEFFFANPEPGNVIDFDRAWDALNMMLTGEAFGSEGPLAIFYYKGEEVGPDGGYGPARYIPSEKMKEFAAALQYLGGQDLAGRFDPVGFEAAQLYSSYLFSEDGIGVDYIMQGIPKLRAFADRCVDTSSGALVAIY